MAPVLKVGAASRSGSIIAGRSRSMAGIAPDTRSLMTRVTDALTAAPCALCGLWPFPIRKIDFTYNVAECASCGNLTGFSADVPATRVESPREKKATAARRAQLTALTRRGARR